MLKSLYYALVQSHLVKIIIRKILCRKCHKTCPKSYELLVFVNSYGQIQIQQPKKTFKMLFYSNIFIPAEI